MEIRIYVANLGAYNAGVLIGEWIELPMDGEELGKRLEAIVAAVDNHGERYGEETAIHDYEAPWTISEYDLLETVNGIAERIAALSAEGDLIEAVLCYYGSDVDTALDVLENGEYTEYSSCQTMGDVAYGIAEDSGDVNTLDASQINGVGYSAYVDWDRVGRDMEINGTFVQYGGGYDNRGTYTGGYIEIHN